MSASDLAMVAKVAFFSCAARRSSNVWYLCVHQLFFEWFGGSCQALSGSPKRERPLLRPSSLFRRGPVRTKKPHLDRLARGARLPNEEVRERVYVRLLYGRSIVSTCCGRKRNATLTLVWAMFAGYTCATLANSNGKNFDTLQ